MNKTDWCFLIGGFLLGVAVTLGYVKVMSL